MSPYPSKRKNFVLDTSVLAHHGESIHSFAGHNVYLPIEVLEELDNLKNRMDSIGSACRYVNRYLDKLRTKGNLTHGVKLDNEQVIFIASFSDMDLLPSGMSDTTDNRIISVAAKLIKDGKHTAVISRDISLRVRCDSLDISAEDYKKNSTSEVDYFYDGLTTIETTKDVIDEFYKNGLVTIEGQELHPNQGVILKAGQASALAVADNATTIRKFYYAHERSFEVEGITARSKEQLFALELLMDPEVHMVSITGMAGCGKAQPLDAKILTPMGWTTMEEIIPGTQVIGRDGTPANVLGVFPQGKKDIYKITFNDGTYTESCDEHLWYTWTQRDRDYGRDGSVKSLNKIRNSIRNKNGKKNHSIPINKPIEFTENIKSDEIEPYILGCLLGDGYIKTDTCISTNDSEIISEFKKFGYNINHISRYDYRIRSSLSRLNLREKLKELKLFGKGAESKFVPDKYKFSGIKDRLEILRGLMDTDGTVSKNGLKSSFSSVSKSLANGVAELVRSLGGKATISSRFTTYTYKGIEKIGRESFRVTVSMPKDLCPFKLPRKVERWLPTKGVNLRRYIDQIELVSQKEAQCIYIDNSDHLYITDNYIVTHNTLLSVAAALSHIHSGTYKKLIISRPVQSTSKDIGFLPGSKLEKMSPWLQPFFDNLSVILQDRGSSYVKMMMDRGTIEVEALTYVRGRTLPDTIFIIDEAQNITHHEAKALLTRMGEGSKIILIGDLEQIDSPTVDQRTSGLSSVVELFKEFQNSGHVRLLKGERSKLATFAAKVM